MVPVLACLRVSGTRHQGAGVVLVSLLKGFRESLSGALPCSPCHPEGGSDILTIHRDREGHLHRRLGRC